MTAWKTYTPNDKQPWDKRRVAHLHRRAVFGLTAGELHRDLNSTAEDSISRILAGEGREGVPDDFKRLSQLIGDTAAGNQNIERLKAWWIYRLLLSPDPLGERITFLWHNHFATSNLKVNNSTQMKTQNETFRRHARTEFGELLHEMLRDPALLKWLDAATNRKGHANENLGRELMELFTIGIGNYTEADVKEAARSLTGIGIKNDQYRFDQRRHDEDEKTVLGVTKTFSPQQLADLLVAHPATPARLAHRLIAEFFAPEVVNEKAQTELAEQLRETNLNTAKAVETILRSELFFSDNNINRRVSDPMTFLIAPLRATEIFKSPPSTLILADWLRRMGLDLFYPPNVAGWPGGRTWLTTRTVIARANYGLAVVSGELHQIPQSPDLERLATKHNVTEPGKFGELMQTLLSGGDGQTAVGSDYKDIVLNLLTGTAVHLH